jgi:hypothetical protein
MQGKDVVKLALASTQNLLSMYIADLSDQDLLTRPVPSANHIAWQLAHLIGSEKALLEKEIPGAVYPEMPANLKEQAGDKTGKGTPVGGFLKKGDYLEWFNKMRNATLANVDRLSDADLDRPTTGPMAAFAPNLGALFILLANHTLMHAGQFTVTRRALNKPVIF